MSAPPDVALHERPAAVAADLLRRVPRRFAPPMLPADLDAARTAGPWAALAFAVEQARLAAAQDLAPLDSLGELFTHALATALTRAMRPDDGDATLQALVARHRWPKVREAAALLASEAADRRATLGAVRAVAHPRRWARRSDDARAPLVRALGKAAATADWVGVAELVGALLGREDVERDGPMRDALRRLRDDEALSRLRRLNELRPDAQVARYQLLIEAQGPAADSDAAIEAGTAAQRRGEATEARAARALMAWVDLLNAADTANRWRVAPSLRVPGSLPGDAAHAKMEWDVALLRRQGPAADEPAAGDKPVWDLLLLIEAKASPDAASADLPRLMRGLRHLAGADAGSRHRFCAADGVVTISGDSLRALPVDEHDLARAVLYCCDGDTDRAPPAFSPASRLRLLSDPVSLDFAVALDAGQTPPAVALSPLWIALRTDPRLRGVLRQHETQTRVRELMAHPDDLAAVVRSLERG